MNVDELLKECAGCGELLIASNENHLCKKHGLCPFCHREEYGTLTDARRPTWIHRLIRRFAE
jgi:hypothetical protein